LSQCSNRASFGQANYSTTKAGTIGFTRTAALELACYNERVNGICPVWIGTDMLEGMPDKVKEGVLARIPLGRIGTPQEVARGVRSLIADGDSIAGATLNINGGAFMQ